MNEIIRFDIHQIIPDRGSVLRMQGISEGRAVPERVGSLLDRAMDLAFESAKPVGMITDVTIEEFSRIFEGEGRNEPDVPFKDIFPRANRLALFAVTVGGEISKKIEALFRKNDFALGAMLDSIASLVADKAVDKMEALFHEDIMRSETTTAGKARRDPTYSNEANDHAVHDEAAHKIAAADQTKAEAASSDILVLSYSPGYCGWHVSAQKKLFEYLEPGKIGISLNESFLMIPLKSVTGVLIAGAPEIHLYEDKYPFCRSCKSPTCLERRRRILGS